MKTTVILLLNLDKYITKETPMVQEFDDAIPKFYHIK